MNKGQNPITITSSECLNPEVSPLGCEMQNPNYWLPGTLVWLQAYNIFFLRNFIS